SYHSIHNCDIEEIKFDGGMVRLLAGEYEGYKGYQGKHLPLDYYDIHLEEGASITIDTPEDDSVMIFTLIGDVYVGDDFIEEKTAAKLTNGNSLKIKNSDKPAQVLFMKSKSLKEPISWAGPIVMNTSEEIDEAFSDLRRGTFIKENINY
ncbi:MAG: pirin family protein, partial [Clostridiales bacterium]|nr:pirin family protein [Clostridiales bacterium]